jgi:DoxX
LDPHIRVVLGVIFFAYGAQKMLGWFGGAGLKEAQRTMHDCVNLPIPLAFLAVTSEFLADWASSSVYWAVSPEVESASLCYRRL